MRTLPHLSRTCPRRRAGRCPPDEPPARRPRRGRPPDGPTLPAPPPNPAPAPPPAPAAARRQLVQRAYELAAAHHDKDLALLALLTHRASDGTTGADAEARRLLELGAKIASLAASSLAVALEGRAERPLPPSYLEGKGQQLRYLAETL
ncbi:MAG TPA: hypothetical protein VFS43_01435, partial [Polyangiaceae bacterium]|nr:hypothetical protein [Polyangiaceae bacterium]